MVYVKNCSSALSITLSACWSQRNW